MQLSHTRAGERRRLNQLNENGGFAYKRQLFFMVILATVEDEYLPQ